MIEIGSTVETPYGIGEVVGKDLPESRLWRWIVLLTEPNERGSDWIKCHRKQTACFFEKDIKETLTKGK